MFRKLIGVFTAVAAAGLLVGVAWASGDEARDVSSSGAIAASANSDTSSSATVGTASDGTSADTQTSTSVGDRTSTSAENSTSTSIDDRSTDNTVGSSDVIIVDSSSTSTTVDATTSTSSTIDDHSTVAITTEPQTYDVRGAGSVTIQLMAGQLVLVDASAAAGWTLEVDKSDGRDIRVEFESGDSDARFEAKVRDGEVRVESRRD